MVDLLSDESINGLSYYLVVEFVMVFGVLY